MPRTSFLGYRLYTFALYPRTLAACSALAGAVLAAGCSHGRSEPWRIVFQSRLHDMRGALIRPRGAVVDADLTSAGLFYASNRRRGRFGEYVDSYEGNPARVVFSRRSALVRKLR